MTDTREQILTVAYNLFLQKGYKEVSIQEITGSLGMTKGAFYYFFKSKEQLFQEVFYRFFVTGMRTDFTQFSHESLYRFYHEYLEYRINQQKDNENDAREFSINIYAYIFDAMKHFPDLVNGVKGSSREEKKAWEEIVGIARNKGEIKSLMSNGQIAEIFIFTSDGLGMHEIVEGNKTDVKEHLRALWDAFYEGLKA